MARTPFTSRIYGAFGDSVVIGQHANSAYAAACMEPGTGVYALGRRLYSPVLRRFLNPDPVSPFESGGSNRYAYCGGDPVNRTDPNGNTWRTWLTSILGVSAPPIRTASGSSGLPHSPAGDTTADAIASPVVLASAVSVVAETIAPLVTLGSIASRTTRAPRAGGVFGAHGSNDGINWANGRRLHPDRHIYETADTIQPIYAADARRRDEDVEVRNLGDMSNIDFVRVSNSNAIVVHIYCYGVADRELMFEHNIGWATTYRL
jgi:RHS repeat-associated protein